MSVRMIKALALALFAVAAQPGLARDCRLTVYFGLDRDDLSPDMQYVLATFLANNPRAYGNVIGHTDALASQAYNMDLSRRRAMTVIDFIERFKSNTVSLATDWRGKLNLVVNTPNAEPLNRRVEIYYHNCGPIGAMPPALSSYVSPLPDGGDDDDDEENHSHPSGGSSASASAGSGGTSASSTGGGSSAAASAGSNGTAATSSGGGVAASASAGPNGTSATSAGGGGASAASAGGGSTSVSSTGG